MKTFTEKRLREALGEEGYVALLKRLSDVNSDKAAAKASSAADKARQAEIARANRQDRHDREMEWRRAHLRRALELRASGMTLAAIGRQLGSVNDASRPVSGAMAAHLVWRGAYQVWKRGDESDPLWAVALVEVAKRACYDRHGRKIDYSVRSITQ